jgi:hypothetical protein
LRIGERRVAPVDDLKIQVRCDSSLSLQCFLYFGNLRQCAVAYWPPHAMSFREAGRAVDA